MDETTKSERVWEVRCSCGFSALFLHPDDAQRVFDAHSGDWDKRPCESASITGKHAYVEGEIDPEETLPIDTVDEESDR